MSTRLAELHAHCLHWVEPFSQKSLASLGITPTLSDQDNRIIRADLCLPYPCEHYRNTILRSFEHHLNLFPGHKGHYAVTLSCSPPRASETQHIKNIIAISSAKGGVGKSTVAAYLAHTAALSGARVGLLDADLYGPSLPTLFACTGHRAELTESRQFIAYRYGTLSLMSIGFLVQTTDAMIWRGPIATRTLLQLLNNTAWPELDYLFIDMPPGTGDIPLSLAQKAGLHGALIISTAQKLAIADAKRGESMWAKVQIPVLGIIDNMSYFVCDHCHTRTPLFGDGLKEHTFHAPVIAHLPFMRSIASEEALIDHPEMTRQCCAILAQVCLALKQHLPS